MVRIVIAIIAVSVVFPSTVATAQTKSSGARPPQVSRGQAPAKAQSKAPSKTPPPTTTEPAANLHWNGLGVARPKSGGSQA